MRSFFLFAASLACSAALLAAVPAAESLDYSIEWRFVEAGRAKVSATKTNGGRQIDVRLESIGLVSKLFKVEDDYRTSLTDGFCATGVFIRANEGRRRRETRITFDGERRRASYHEQDLVKNSTALQKEIDTPACVHDIIGALFALRDRNIDLGHFVDLPLSDGKKSVTAKVEAQEREKVKTPAGTFQTIRYEAYVFDNVLYSRKGRMFVWLTDDDRRLPVQMRVRLGLTVGTINVLLTKESQK